MGVCEKNRNKIKPQQVFRFLSTHGFKNRGGVNRYEYTQ